LFNFSQFPRLGAVRAYLVNTALSTIGSAMAIVVGSVYLIVDAGLDPLQLILVGTVLEATVFVFEIPTGVVADVHSRRTSMIIGAVLVGTASIVVGLFPDFTIILAAQVLFGVGATFQSGASPAWIADELDNKGVGQVYLMGSQVARVGGIVGIVLGTVLGSGFTPLPLPDLAVPLVASGILGILSALFMAMMMPETGFRPLPRDERGTWRTMARTFGEGTRLVRRRPDLVSILAIALFFGISSEPIDRFWELHVLEISAFSLPAQDILGPAAWWGLIGITTSVLSMGVAEIVRRKLDLESPLVMVRALSIINAVGIAGVVGFALAGNLGIALAAYLAYTIVRGVGGPIKASWTNQQLDSGVRATVFSMAAQVDAIGQVASGPGMGLLATRVSVRATLLLAAALLTPPQAIYMRLVRRKKAEG
jgi:MFS transporter, DHA3 family, tetracycline resistance protein